MFFEGKKKDKTFGYADMNGLLCTAFCKKNWIKMANISDRVTKIIVDKLGVDESEISSEASFTNDLGADSLDTVELIMELEKEFDISIPDEKAEAIATVGDAVSYIESAVA